MSSLLFLLIVLAIGFPPCHPRRCALPGPTARIIATNQSASGFASEPQPGVRRLLIYAPNNALLTNGVIANIPFAIPLGTRASTLPLSLTNVILATALANSTVSANVSGLIIINPVFVRPDRDVNLIFIDIQPDQALGGGIGAASSAPYSAMSRPIWRTWMPHCPRRTH